MTPQERLALALQYQKQRDLGSALPSTPAENAARPVQEPEQSWLDKLSEAASGFGYRKAQDLEGLAQAAMHPVDTLHSLAVGVGKAMDNPSAAAQAAWQGLKQSAGEAVSSPYNLGSAVAGMTSFNPRKLAAMLESPAVREIVAYHGTGSIEDFPKFDIKKQGSVTGAKSAKNATWFTDNPKVASGYAVHAAESAPVATALNEANAYEKLAQKTNDNKYWDLYDQKLQEAEKLESESWDRRQQFARVKTVDIPDELDLHVVDAKGKTPQELSKTGDIDSWLQKQLDDAKKANKLGVKILNLDDTAGGYDMPATHYGIFNPSNVRILSTENVIPKKK